MADMEVTSDPASDRPLDADSAADDWVLCSDAFGGEGSFTHIE
jgi:hypothetical protein